MWENDPTHGRTRGGMVETYATIAGFLVLAGAVGANALSHMSERGELPMATFFHPDQGMKRLAKAAPSASPDGGQALARRPLGVDSISTATIPGQAGQLGQAGGPAGDAAAAGQKQSVTVIRGVGMETTVVSPVGGGAPPALNPCGDASKQP
jgi:hypothetical protein